MRRFTVVLTFLAFVTLFGYAISTFSQISVAQLNGTVLDESGGAVGKASVTLREMDTNHTNTGTTNDSGFYVMPNLSPGRYELKISFAGFSGYTQTGIVLTVGQIATINVSLKVATRGEQVVVTGEAPVIEPGRTEISQVIDTQKIDALPISGRLFTDFALLTPGVATSRTSLGTTFTEYEATQISFGGMRSFSNEVTVDGADFVNTISGVQRSTPPQESAQEFRVVNNSFGSEYGRALGGIVNIVTKSGTNELHGSLYDYFQNSALDSRSLLQPAPLPHELRQNQFGGTIGGPIKQNKTFFFANYEGKRRAESPTYAPDLISNLGTIDAAKAALGLAPEGCFAALSACTGSNQSFLNGFLKTADNDYGFARLDHQINTNNRLAIRYVVEDARDTGELVGQTLDGGGIGVPSGGRNLFIRDQSVVGTLDTSLRPNLINTALVQYARRHYNFPGATGQPDLSVVNDLEFGHNFGTYDAIYESRLQGSDSVAWVKGNHVAKFGFDGNYIWGQNNYPGFTPERIVLPNLDCLNAFANFVGGTALPTAACPLPGGDAGVAVVYFGVALPRDPTFTGGFPLNNNSPLDTNTWANAFPPSLKSSYTYNLNHGYWGVFAQDQWRLSHNLTLNYGLRWDVETGLSNEIDKDYNGFQPRIGIAWSPNSKTVVRAGFGIFDDRQNLTFFYTTGNQKTVSGYLCNPPTGIASCAGVTPQMLPMVRTGAANGGWQLLAVPPPGAPDVAALILTTGTYIPVALNGTCNPATGAACGIGAGGMDRHQTRTPYAEQASFEIDRHIGGGLTIDVGYLFVGAHKLIRGNNINVPCPVGTTKPGAPVSPFAVQGWLNPDGTLTPCDGQPTLAPVGSPIAGLGPWFQGIFNTGFQNLSAGLLDYNNGVANAVYHGLTISAIEKWGKHFNLNANYTYSHVIDNGNFTTFINLPENQFDYGAERANSNQDVRHHFVTNFTVTAPESSFLRHFEFSSIITAQSGRPFTLFVGNDTFNDLAGSATDRVGGAPVVGSCVVVQHCTTTVSRNTYVGDGLYTWDFRVSRDIIISERMRVALSMDAFNALNRANVDEVTSVYGSPIFCGAVPRHYQDAASVAIQNGAVGCPVGLYGAPGGINVFVPPAPNSVFGLPRTVLNPRQFQFAAKFIF